MIAIEDIKHTLLNALSKDDKKAKVTANALNKSKEYLYRIINDCKLSIIEFIYLCYVFKINLNEFIPITEQLNILYDKAENPYEPSQIEILINPNKADIQIPQTINENITLLEKELLSAFRDIGKKHGHTTQINILNKIYELT